MRQPTGALAACMHRLGCNWGHPHPCNWGHPHPCNWGHPHPCNWGHPHPCNWGFPYPCTCSGREAPCRFWQAHMSEAPLGSVFPPSALLMRPPIHRRFGMRGRLWVLFLLQASAAAFCCGLSRMGGSLGGTMATAVCMGVTETAAAGERVGWLGWLWHVADIQGWPGIPMLDCMSTGVQHAALVACNCMPCELQPHCGVCCGGCPAPHGERPTPSNPCAAGSTFGIVPFVTKRGLGAANGIIGSGSSAGAGQLAAGQWQQQQLLLLRLAAQPCPSDTWTAAAACAGLSASFSKLSIACLLLCRLHPAARPVFHRFERGLEPGLPAHGKPAALCWACRVCCVGCGVECVAQH